MITRIHINIDWLTPATVLVKHSSEYGECDDGVMAFEVIEWVKILGRKEEPTQQIMDKIRGKLEVELQRHVEWQ